MIDVMTRMAAQGLVLAFALFASLSFIVSSSAGSILKFVSVIMVVATLWLMLQRDTYLPFLGYAAFPMSLVPTDFAPVKANTEITVPMDGVPDGTRMIYWGAQPASGDGAAPTPKAAYGDYANAGVATIRRNEVTIRFHCPTEYYVPMGHKLKRHIHYRLCGGKHGLMGPVRTLWVKC